MPISSNGTVKTAPTAWDEFLQTGTARADSLTFRGNGRFDQTANVELRNHGTGSTKIFPLGNNEYFLATPSSTVTASDSTGLIMLDYDNTPSFTVVLPQGIQGRRVRIISIVSGTASVTVSGKGSDAVYLMGPGGVLGLNNNKWVEYTFDTGAWYICGHNL